MRPVRIDPETFARYEIYVGDHFRAIGECHGTPLVLHPLRVPTAKAPASMDDLRAWLRIFGEVFKA